MDIDQRLDAMQPEIIKGVQRLVRVRSVEALGEGGKPFGTGVHACFEETLKLCAELGFQPVNMDDMTGWCEYGEGREMIAVLGHLDVVPEAEGWAQPPYEARLVDGRIVGRGTQDDKGPLVAALYALKAIKDAGIPLKRRVRLLFGLNEETGALDMQYYCEHGGEIPVAGFTPDGEYPLINGEKGIINETYQRLMTQTGAYRILSLRGGVAGNVAPDHAAAELLCPEGAVLPKADKITLVKTAAGYHVEAQGVSAHGSHPETGENAIGRLAIYLDQLPFTGDGKAMLSFLATKIGMDCFGELIGCPLKDELSGRLSFNMGVVEGDEKAVRVTLNYRYPVTLSAEDCQPAVLTAFEKAGWQRLSAVHKAKLYIPESSALVKTLLKVYREATGDMTPPKAIGGGTYAKAIPNILAFGPIFPGDEITEHKPNEYITVERLMQNAKIIAAAMVALANQA